MDTLNKFLWVVAFCSLLSGCSEPAPNGFDITGLWCEGADGICMSDENEHTSLYLFGNAALKDNPKLKVSAKIELYPIDQIAQVTSGEHIDYYRQEDLVNLITLQLQQFNSEISPKLLEDLNYPTPAASALTYQNYLIDKATAEIDLFTDSADTTRSRVECEAKLKQIVVEQYQPLLSFFLRRNQFTGFESWSKRKANAALQACLRGQKSLAADDGQQVQNQISAIRFLSVTEIELGGRHLTRIPLSSLKERLRAEDTEMRTLIARLSLEEALKKSIAFLNCDATETQCETDEFYPGLAKTKAVLAEMVPDKQLPANDAEATAEAARLKAAEEDAAHLARLLAGEPQQMLQASELSNAEILQVLFGNYDPQQDRALVQDLFLQGENGKAAELFVKAETKVLWSTSIVYKGAAHKLAILVSRQLDAQGRVDSCSGCLPILGAALLGQVDRAWKAAVLTPFVMRAAEAEDLNGPVTLESVGVDTWVLRFDAETQAGKPAVVTSLLALLPAQASEPAVFINPISLATYVDERTQQTECAVLEGCKVYNVKLEYNRLAGAPLYDLVATTQGYVKTAYGARKPLNTVDYYVFNGRQYQKDVVKSASLSEQVKHRQCNPCLSLGRLDWPYFE